MSAPVVVFFIGISSTNSSRTVKSSFTPRTNTASWAVSIASVLSSIAMEKNCSFFETIFLTCFQVLRHLFNTPGYGSRGKTDI